MSGEQQEQPQRRPRLRGEERRKLMLQSAKRVFARSNYAEASTSELAHESEVTEPMLYKHFGSKKGLFLAVLNEFGTQFFEMIQERVLQRAEKDVLDALEHFIDDYKSALKADPDIQRVLFQAVIETSDPDIARCISKHNRRTYEFVRQLVERASKEGYIDPTISIDAATWGYMSMLLSHQYSTMLNLSGEFTQVQQEMSRIWLRGLRVDDD